MKSRENPSTWGEIAPVSTAHRRTGAHVNKGSDTRSVSEISRAARYLARLLSAAWKFQCQARRGPNENKTREKLRSALYKYIGARALCLCVSISVHTRKIVFIIRYFGKWDTRLCQSPRVPCVARGTTQFRRRCWCALYQNVYISSRYYLSVILGDITGAGPRGELLLQFVQLRTGLGNVYVESRRICAQKYYYGLLFDQFSIFICFLWI